MGPLDQVLPAHPVLSQHIKLASDDWYVGSSEVAGQGVFAGKDYEPGDRIGIAMTDGGEDEFSAKIWNLTELARYCNHQNRNNVDIEKDGDRFHLVAIKPIGQDEELVSNYWQVARAKGPHSVMLYEGKQVPTSDLSDYVEKEAADKKEFVHSCCGEPSGKCAGCSEGSVLILKDEYEKAGNRTSRNEANS